MLLLDANSISTAAKWSELPDYVNPQVFLTTISDSRFPGAILPRVTKDGNLIWYAVVDSSQNWRRLRPILMAFAGPTITDFKGVESELDPFDDFDALLLNVANGHFARLIPSKENSKMAAYALSRCVSTIRRAPSIVDLPKKSTSTLLTELDLHIASGDRNGAERCLSILSNEWHLSVVNLRYIEVRIAAVFQDWSKLVVEPWFEELCYAPKPAYISHALLEAVWYSRLEQFSEEFETLENNYVGQTREICANLLTEAYCIGGVAVNSIAELEASKSQGDENDQILTFLKQKQPETAIGWEEFVNRIGDGFTEDLPDAAYQASLLQPATVIQKKEIKNISEKLQEMSIDDKYLPTLQKVIPEFVRWLKCDPDFPRFQLKPLYQTALTILTMIGDKSSVARYLLLDIFDALLEFQPEPTEYRQHVQDITSFISGAGISTVYWLIELTERLIYHPTTDPEVRLSLLNEILSSLQPFGRVLSNTQRISYSRIASVADWPPLPELVEYETEHNQLLSLNNKLVAIYTLAERAGSEASSIIRQAYSGVRVKVNSDHVCTPKLKSLAKEADLFVIVPGSAKHAATDCIKQNRPPSEISTYATGRGATSIVRAIEETVRNQW